MFGVGTPYDGQAAIFGNGAMIALVLDERAKVDTVCAKAVALGAQCEGASACAATRAIRCSTRPVSPPWTAIRCAPSRWDRPGGRTGAPAYL